MKLTAALVERLERLEKRFPGLCDALREERLEVATKEELKAIGEQLEGIEAMLKFQARYGHLETLPSERPGEEGSD